MSDERFDRLEKMIGGLSYEIKEVRAEVGSLSEEMKEVRAEVGSLSEEMKEVRAEVGSLSADVGSLSYEMKEVRAEVASVGREIVSIKEFIVDEAEKNTGRYHDLKEEIGQVKLQLTDLTTIVKYHQQKISEHDINIFALKESCNKAG